MRAALYLRLSRETEASTSIERQREACERLCAERGWKVVLVAEDVDVSASKRRLDRPGLDRVRAAYADLDAVVFWRTDRLARSIVDFAALMEEADRSGVALVSATEALDLSTPVGRAMAQIVAIFAEMEARTISERVRSSYAHLRRTGRSIGGRVPYWLQRVPNPDGPGFVEVVDEPRAALVLEAVDRVLDGEGLRSIAADLTRRGEPAPYGGGSWHSTGLRSILTNPGLVGRVVLHGETVRDEETGLPAVLRPPILDLATFQRVERALGDRRRVAPGGHGPAGSLLSGLLLCGSCGRRMVSAGARYACPSGRHGLADCPLRVTVSKAEADRSVSESFLASVGRFEVVRRVPVSGSDHSSEIEEVRASLGDLEADRYERGLFSGPDGAARFAEIHARLTARLRSLEADERPSGVSIERTGETFDQVWGRSSTSDRRFLLLEALDGIEVGPGRRGARFSADRLRLLWSAEDAEIGTNAGESGVRG